MNYLEDANRDYVAQIRSPFDSPIYRYYILRAVLTSRQFSNEFHFIHHTSGWVDDGYCLDNLFR